MTFDKLIPDPYNQSMVDSRQRILEHLKRTGEASVADLSSALSLTPVTIRHHLAGLQTDGLISSPVPRRKQGPGRPEMIYRATSAADAYMPRNYGELCTCLLSALRSAPSDLDLERLLEQIGRDLGGSARRDSAEAEPPMPDAVEGRPNSFDAMRFLDQRGYFPSISRAGGTNTLELANCPFLEVAQTTPSLCQFDRALIGELFGQKVEIHGRIIRNDPVCTFQFVS